ncbi:MAG: glycosyltransferase family 9 protein [Pseudomonadota bacterium]
MKILIVRLSSLGDVVHTLPAVRALKNHFPDASLTWVIEEAASDLLRGYPGVDRVIVSRRKQWLADIGRCAFSGPALEIKKFVSELRDDLYDLIIDFQGLLKSGLLAGLARGEKKLGFRNAREGAALFYTDKAPPPAFNAHALKRHLALVAPLGITDPLPEFASLFGKEDDDAIAKLFAHEGISGDKALICMHPSAMWPTKLWGREKIAGLCDMLQHAYNCEILCVGGAGEKKYLEAICALVAGKVKNMAGKTTLRQLACLISKARLMISMDSGPMHLACVVGTPVVAVFGPTAPWRTGPFGRDYRVARKELPCSPCFQRKICPAKHHRCMKDITVEDVFKLCCNYLP